MGGEKRSGVGVLLEKLRRNRYDKKSAQADSRLENGRQLNLHWQKTLLKCWKFIVYLHGQILSKINWPFLINLCSRQQYSLTYFHVFIIPKACEIWEKISEKEWQHKFKYNADFFSLIFLKRRDLLRIIDTITRFSGYSQMISSYRCISGHTLLSCEQTIKTRPFPPRTSVSWLRTGRL